MRWIKKTRVTLSRLIFSTGRSMRHADLRREATAVIVKPASALLYDTAVWYLVWACGCVLCGWMSDAMDKKNTCNTFSTDFFDWQIKSKKSSFSTRSLSRKTQSKKVESKMLFFDCCARKPELGFSRKRPFSTEKSDSVRNSLIPQKPGLLLVGVAVCNRYFFFARVHPSDRWRSRSSRSSTIYPSSVAAVMSCCARSVHVTVQLQRRKRVLNHADRTAPTRRH